MSVTRVLIIEDDSQQRTLLARLLQQTFSDTTVEVVPATTVESAREQLDGSIDAVLLDLTLPRHHGRASFDALQPQLEGVPTVIISGNSDEGLARELVRSGAQDYLIKGRFDAELLRRTIRHAIEREGLRRSLVESEAALRASAARFRSQFEQSPIPILVWRLRGDDFEFVEYNAAAERFSQGTAMNLEGTVASQVLPAQPRLLAAMQACARERSSERVQVDFSLGSQRHRTIDITIGFVEPDLLLLYTQDISEVKRSELALRESERNYRTLFEQAPAGIVITDATTAVIESNDRARQMIGYSAEEFTGIRLADLLDPDSLATNPLRLDDLKRLGSLRHERMFKRKDGSTFPVEITAAVLEDGRLLAMARDLTEERRVQQQVAFQADLLANVQNSVIATDSAGRVVYWNKSAQRMYGWTADEAIGRTLTSLNVPPEHQSVSEGLFHRLSEAGHWEGEDLAIRKDGKRFPIYLTLSNVTDSIGTVTGAVGVSFDLSERYAAEGARLKAEQALKESEEHFRSMIEHSSDITSILHPEDGVLYQSPSIERILGYKSDELLGTNAFRIVHPDDITALQEAFERQLREPGDSSGLEVRLLHADQTYRSFHIVTQTVRWSDGELRLIANARDVTERNMLAQKLEQANRISDLGRLATIIAHEINNVMMGISPFAEVIKQQATDPSIVRAAEQIVRSIQRGRRITQEILRFAQPVEPSLQIIAATEFFRAIEPEARTFLPSDIELEIVCGDDSIRLPIDLELMMQVLTNLMLNAKDAMPGGGTISIACRRSSRDRERIVIEVADTGAGMSEEVASHAFEPLYTTKRRGTGLGLAIVKQIITNHHGDIRLQSEPGGGTRFVIELPGLSEAAASPVPGTQPAPEIPESLRVLLAEDDPAVSAGLQALLELEGFEVETVERGRDVEPAIERFHPEILLLDYGLPDETGADVFRRVAARWPALPVIFSTGHADQAIIRGLADSSRVGYLLKPYETAALLAEIRRVTAGAPSAARPAS